MAQEIWGKKTFGKNPKPKNKKFKENPQKRRGKRFQKKKSFEKLKTKNKKFKEYPTTIIVDVVGVVY